VWKNIKGMGRNDFGELEDDSRGRWGRISGLRGRVGIGRGNSRGKIRM
jgi:hypothetical protein